VGVDESLGMLLPGKEMASLGDAAYRFHQAGHAEDGLSFFAEIISEIKTQRISQAVDETFDLPGNAHVINRDRVNDGVSLKPSVPEFLEPIFQATFPLQFSMGPAGIAGSEWGLSEDVRFSLHAVRIGLYRFIEGLLEKEKTVPLPRASTDP
jgi:hypothetical protein